MQRKEFAAPDIAEVVSYASRMGESADEAQRFYDYYNSQGWKKGNGLMIQDWRSAFNSWIRNIPKFGDESIIERNRKEAQKSVIMEMSRFLKPANDDEIGP